MDGAGFSDREFFEEQQAADRRWILPLNLAIAAHIAVLAGALYLPGIIRHRPLLDEVVTVDLVSLPEPAAPARPVHRARPAAPPRPPAPKPKPAPKPAPEPAGVAVTPGPEVTPRPAAPSRPISIRPLRRKIRKARDTRLAEEKQRQRLARERKRQEQARQKALARAREEERKAEEARRRAVAALAALIRTSDAVGPSNSRSSSAGGKQVRSIVFKQYLSALYDRVHSYWVLPEMRRWDPGLEAVVVLTIRRDGTVVRATMEKKSRDPFFDQFVMKTIQSASPMPRFSKLMHQDTIEVGLRFRPGELSM